MSTILGLNPSTPTSEDRKAPKGLGRLSLAQLSNRIRDLQAVSNLHFGNIGIGRQKGIKGTPTGEEESGELISGKDLDVDLGGLEARRDKSSDPLTTKQARKRFERTTSRRLNRLGEARRSLISRVTGARTERASQITTLLGRGI